MKLSVGARLRLLRILPETGNVVTLKVIAKARDAIALSAEEIENFGIKFVDDKVVWKTEIEPVEIEFSTVVKGIICDNLKRLDQEGNLNMLDLELWELFVEGEKDES